MKTSRTTLINKLFTSKPSFRVWGSFLILVASYTFLIYKLLTFNHYHELATQWKQMPLTQFRWLAGVFILLPINWLLEAIKWKRLIAIIEDISIKKSYNAVLAGISTGFFTPNRVGEMVGRILYLDADHRKAGVTLSLVNSLTQNLVITIVGVPACLIFFTFTSGTLEADIADFILAMICFALLFGLFYFALPLISKKIEGSSIGSKVGTYTDCLSDYKRTDLIVIIAISMLRFFVFATQFYLMLRFFGIHLDPWQAIIAIPSSYLFVTFTPSVAFSEAAVRSSYAVLFIGAFSGQIVGIALAGVAIWAVNFIIPMLVGSVVMMRKKE
ncbi:MAG: lysylphosphatidylglycerol synthase domain-containing protein [Paludibacter sp.]